MLVDMLVLGGFEGSRRDPSHVMSGISSVS